MVRQELRRPAPRARRREKPERLRPSDVPKHLQRAWARSGRTWDSQDLYEHERAHRERAQARRARTFGELLTLRGLYRAVRRRLAPSKRQK